MSGDPEASGCAVAALVSRWGLPAGSVVRGWTLRRVVRSATGDAALLALERGPVHVEVRVQRASEGPRFARVGVLDLSHSSVADGATRDVGELLKVLAAWLLRRGAGAELAALLAPRVAGAAPAQAAVPPGGAYEAGDPPPLDPARRTNPDRPFMRFETIELSELERYPDALREMYEGTLGGLVIRNVYDKAFMQGVVARLAGNAGNYPRTSFPARFRGHFYGRCLDGSDPALAEYLDDAARFRDESLAVFAGGAPFEPRMEAMFRALAGGRDVRLPRYIDDRPYTPATIRILLEGGQIGTHCGNEASTRPAYTHLNSMIDRGDQISYFLTLQEAAQGGELIVYSLKWSDIDPSRIVGGRSNVDELLHDAEWLPVAPTAGDLLLFDGGRYFHRVDVVVGDRVRWTMGGFMMFGRAGDAVYYWS